MEFINSWLDEESGNMRKFLELVSGPPPEDWIHGLETQGGARPGQLGRHMSSLHTVLVENVGKVRHREGAVNTLIQSMLLNLDSLILRTKSI